MVGDDEDVYAAELVGGAHELHFLGPGEVAEVEDFELAEGDFGAERTSVFGGVGGAGLGGLAEFVGWPAPGRRVEIMSPSAVMTFVGHSLNGRVSPGWARMCLYLPGARTFWYSA